MAMRVGMQILGLIWVVATGSRPQSKRHSRPTDSRISDELC